MKRTMPLIIASATGILLVIAYFLPEADLGWLTVHPQDWGNSALKWFDILAAIAFVLGAGNLMLRHLQKISDQQPGWAYSAITLAAFFITLTVGLGKFGVHPSDSYPTYGWSGEYDQPGSHFWWIFQYVFLPLNATTFAMLAFYVASAAFRAFRIKNLEAGILLVTAAIVLLGQTSTGTALTASIPDEVNIFGWIAPTGLLRLEVVKETIMQVFNTAGTRAINIGIALGIAATSLRVLVGIDRPYIGSGDA